MKRRHGASCALLLAVLAVAGTITAAATARSTAVPRNTAAPKIGGTAREGQTLTTTNGTWEENPTAYAYQWQRCAADGSGCAAIVGATKQGYTAVSADVDHRLRAIVTASNVDGQSSATSGLSVVVSSSSAPVNTAKPAISGTLVPGEDLTATTGTWTGGVRSYAYRWQRCAVDGGSCTLIAGATAKTYSVHVADVGHTLRVVVTATNASGSAASVTSDATAVVGNGTTTSTATTTTVVTTTVAGNRAPRLSFLSLKRVGRQLYARFRVCDDRYGRMVVTARDNKARALAHTRKFTVTASCASYTRHWLLLPRFRSHGRLVVTLRAQDRSGALSKLVSRSLTIR